MGRLLSAGEGRGGEVKGGEGSGGEGRGGEGRGGKRGDRIGGSQTHCLSIQTL